MLGLATFNYQADTARWLRLTQIKQVTLCEMWDLYYECCLDRQISGVKEYLDMASSGSVWPSKSDDEWGTKVRRHRSGFDREYCGSEWGGVSQGLVRTTPLHCCLYVTWYTHNSYQQIRASLWELDSEINKNKSQRNIRTLKDFSVWV